MSGTGTLAEKISFSIINLAQNDGSSIRPFATLAVVFISDNMRKKFLSLNRRVFIRQ